MMNLEHPKISVVITTKNEEKNIANCLESIQAQTWPNIEIIVVDNSSTDQTQSIAKQYTDKVYTKGPERSTQRNYGIIEKSTGLYVLFLDADMILTPYVIESSYYHIIKNQGIALYIKEVVLGKNYFSKARRFERGFYDATVVDGARFFRKDTFIEIKGFDENLNGPEDWDLDKRLKQKGKILMLPSKKPSDLPVLESSMRSTKKNFQLKEFLEKHGVRYEKDFVGLYHNEVEFELLNYIKKKNYYSANFDMYIKKWGKDDKDLRKQLGFSYRYIWVFLENGKWKKLLIYPMLALGMFFLRFIVGVVFIFRNMRIKK